VSTRRTSNRLERRAERAGKQIGGSPRPYRQRASRTPVKVGGGGGINWSIYGGALAVAVIAGIIIYAFVQSTAVSSDSTPDFIKAILDDSPKLPGQYIAPHPGADGELCTTAACLGTADDRQHFGNGVVRPICTQEQIAANQIAECYTSNPPTSGPHASSPAQFKILENPAPKENLLHSMEHGAVVVWYNTDDQAVINQLTDWVNEEIDRRRLLVMTKYTEMEPNTIALTAWTRLDKFPVSDLTKKRVVDFIEAHNKRFNPEGF
jgi:hypothetical protein